MAMIMQVFVHVIEINFGMFFVFYSFIFASIGTARVITTKHQNTKNTRPISKVAPVTNYTVI